MLCKCEHIVAIEVGAGLWRLKAQILPHDVSLRVSLISSLVVWRKDRTKISRHCRRRQSVAGHESHCRHGVARPGYSFSAASNDWYKFNVEYEKGVRKGWASIHHATPHCSTSERHTRARRLHLVEVRTAHDWRAAAARRRLPRSKELAGALWERPGVAKTGHCRYEQGVSAN